MKKTIGNVGTLNLTEATEESISAIQHINNVGLLLYSTETASLVPKLSIGNLGYSLRIPKDAQVINGLFTVDNELLTYAKPDQTIIINGLLTFSNDLRLETILETELSFIVNGIVYVPSALKGSVNRLIKKHSGVSVDYTGSEPKLLSGDTLLTNTLVDSYSPKTNVALNGILTLAADLDLEQIRHKIESIQINGIIELYEHQVASVMSKVTINGTTRIIPTDYKQLKSVFQLSSKSIRRFKQERVYTTKPIVLDKSITREAFQDAFTSIHSHSFILCSEDIEDLVYEVLNRFETDVYTYKDDFRFITNETWKSETLQQLESPTTIVVYRYLRFDDPLSSEIIKDHSIVLLGEISVLNEQSKHVIQQRMIENKNGLIHTSDQQERGLSNYGELSL
ncbi:hypothetical protein [Shouchella lehensis]|uniref:Uncharacterized protein n=1 Tax=Shouchella lehensis G1 TaxID=1246626 RepID=A0A060LX86_9BACI|nr:hypothetical protein [Shouchella lehensis]AIC95881.1 hypothetical protein BleG1_3334 [Shouchella lehensis G1]